MSFGATGYEPLVGRHFVSTAKQDQKQTGALSIYTPHRAEILEAAGRFGTGLVSLGRPR